MKSDRFSRCLTALVLATAAAMLAACTTTPTPVSTYNTGFRLVIPPTTGAVTLDGLANEAAWADGFRFVMEDGVPGLSAAVLRGVADASSIYLYAEVEDINFNDSDVVVIGFNPDGASNNYRRIHVFPCKPAGVCDSSGNTQQPTIEYWTGSLSGGSFVWTSQPVGALQAKTATATGATKKWSAEVKVPRGAPFNFVDTNFFGMFVDVVRTDPTVGLGGEAVQYTWPPAERIGSTSENDIFAQLETGTPVPSKWGNATLSKVFGKGVTISSNELRSNQADPGKISLNAPNIFYGTAANYSSSGGTLVAANDVNATFKIANNGLPALGSFANVPVGGNPAGPANIAPTAAHTFQTGTWNLTPQQQADYGANVNQCIRVELTTTNPNTVIITPSVMRNMQFVTTSSPFRERAAFTAKGVETSGRRVDFTLREQFLNFDPQLRWTTEIGNATRVADKVYRAQLGPGADGVLDITVQPPNLRIPSVDVAIPPGTGGPRPNVRFAVAPGELVTVIASGNVLIDGVPVSGAGAGEVRGDDKTGLRPGTLLGSFDGFKTSFVIGTASTVKVPEGAAELQMKLHDTLQGYEKQRGEGLQLQVVRSRIDKWMLQANPDLGRVVRGDDVHVAVGANLPTWLLRGERDTGRVVRINGKTFRVFEPMGSFAYVVKRIN
ncbi:hypothetical protein PO002_33580 [Cupriavidus necator]|uniref:hypothetical protein n=1 Tax=Cupriavidus necator TaxID=106590 RepID=UPI0039C17618